MVELQLVESEQKHDKKSSRRIFILWHGHYLEKILPEKYFNKNYLSIPLCYIPEMRFKLICTGRLYQGTNVYEYIDNILPYELSSHARQQIRHCDSVEPND